MSGDENSWEFSETPSAENTPKTAFEQKLTDIRRRGCCVLVAGHIDPCTAARASNSLFGEEPASTTGVPARKRVLALTDRSHLQASRHLPGDAPLQNDRHWVANIEQETRCAPIASDPDVSLAAPGNGISELSDLRTEVQNAIDYYARESGSEFEAGELRVGLNSIAYLFEEYGFTAVQRLIRDIKHEMVDHHGMAHLVCPCDDTSLGVDDLDSLFDDGLVDIVVRVRRKRDDLPPEEQFLIPGFGRLEWEQLQG